MRKKWWILALAALLGLVVVAGGVWYFVFRDTSPAAVSIDSASKAAEDAKASSNSGGTGSGSTNTSNLDGTWTVSSTIGSFSDFTSSFAGFRVQEQLAGIGAKTAVGRTPNVTGTMTIDGNTIPKTAIDVDMTTLTSDDSRRDGQMRTQGIETSKFPKASFTLTQPIELGSLPADGQKITVNAVGDLNLHGVTKQVTFPLEAQRTGDVIVVVGQLEIPFSDYSISRPTSAAVLSVEDKGIMEVQLFFTKTA
jgi:polyisoprenoid-binding protein YceI